MRMISMKPITSLPQPLNRGFVFGAGPTRPFVMRRTSMTVVTALSESLSHAI